MAQQVPVPGIPPSESTESQCRGEMSPLEPSLATQNTNPALPEGSPLSDNNAAISETPPINCSYGSQLSCRLFISRAQLGFLSINISAALSAISVVSKKPGYCQLAWSFFISIFDSSWKLYSWFGWIFRTDKRGVRWHRKPAFGCFNALASCRPLWLWRASQDDFYVVVWTLWYDFFYFGIMKWSKLIYSAYRGSGGFRMQSKQELISRLGEYFYIHFSSIFHNILRDLACACHSKTAI